ncbi:hypothetical protein Nepgr_008785 [Nepenthes gracilis]|uniref:Uncharacterized protein n=1 Tax=Nepenthes gracilis TaxID=150966 RepID=A0AAD3XJQ4_NEPGR|nr:hypothetical protein Nepgr_008785 [Nepenthes gracilis]
MSTQPSRPISNIMAVSSRKGGVEKTTVAVNCAYDLASMDAGVGVLAANADGPNLPIMVSLEPRILGMNPECLGVRLEFLGNAGQGRAVTRGPMVSKVINQLLTAAEWGELYYLFIDMPPEHDFLEKDASYYLTPIGAFDPIGGGLSEETLVMAMATVTHFHHVEDPGDHDNDGQVKAYLKETFLNECQMKIMGKPPDKKKSDSNGSEKHLPVCSNGQGSANTLPIREATYVAAEDSCDCEIGDHVTRTTALKPEILRLSEILSFSWVIMPRSLEIVAAFQSSLPSFSLPVLCVLRSCSSFAGLCCQLLAFHPVAGYRGGGAPAH